MEAVAPDAFIIEIERYGIMVSEGTMAAMESRIEAGDLRQIRKTPVKGLG